jgi:hypothetical protein
MTTKYVALSVNLDYSAVYYEGETPDIDIKVLGVFDSNEELNSYQLRRDSKYIDKVLEIEV